MIIHGDCIEELRKLPDNSVDAVITDPPYGLSNTDPSHVAETITQWVHGNREYLPPVKGGGFMGKAWDSFVPPVAVWDECLRVLKPGGHLLSFAGSRTMDLMTLGIRLAGFDIRDSIAWLYGSGFPKSLDVSKAIDKAGGASPEAQSRVLRAARERSGLSREDVAAVVGCTPSSIRDWEEGRARAKGRTVEFITPSPTYRDKLADLLGYTADERAVAGVCTDRRGDKTVIGLGHSGIEYGAPSTEAAQQWEGWGTALKPAFEPIIMARKPLVGTVAANVLKWGTGALNIDASRIPASDPEAYAAKGASVVGLDSNRNGAAYGEWTGTREDSTSPQGRFPANVILDESQAAALDEQSGITKSTVDVNLRAEGTSTWFTGEEHKRVSRGDSGGASRFFYCAKAGKAERPVVDGTAHATVKPLALMRYLVKLVTPPGGTVLEPFAGSGTTVEACILEGFRCIAIEREADYLPLIEARMNRAVESLELL